MIKKFFSFCVVFFVIVGALNVLTINGEVIKDVTQIVAEKPVKEIPKNVLTKITAHHWKIVK